jgi:hypothetical protein
MKDTQPVEVTGSNVLQDGTVKTSMTTSLDSTYDSINVNKMSKGGSITAIPSGTAVTTTSAEVPCNGFNAVLVHVVITGTGTWNISLQASPESGGNFVDAYDGANKMTTGDITSSRCVSFRGITDYLKVVATEVADGATCLVKVVPLNN